MLLIWIFGHLLKSRDSLHKILDMGVLGYTDLSDKFFLSIQRWYKKQYNMDIPREWIVFCPRINIASSICVETYTEKGDGIIMHTPAYGPLQNSILKNNRKMLSSPLKKMGNTMKWILRKWSQWWMNILK